MESTQLRGVSSGENPARSSITVDNSGSDAGYISAVRLFSSLTERIGSDVEYIKDPVNGDYFRLVRDGVYSVAWSDTITLQSDGSGGMIGLTMNNSDASLNLSTVENSKLLMVTAVADGIPNQVAITRWFPANTTIRAQFNFYIPNGGYLSKLTITRVN